MQPETKQLGKILIEAGFITPDQLQDALRHQRIVGDQEVLLVTGALQTAIFNSANFSSIATDAKGVIQMFNVGAERMLGYSAAEVLDKITPADISDPQEVIARARALSLELGTTITPGFEALVFKASRGIEDIYQLTYIRKDGSRFPAIVSVTALRDAQGGIIGYLLIGTDNTARKQAEEALLKAGALQTAIFNSANFSIIATDEKGVIQLFNVGAERMLGYVATDVVNKITPAEISDPQEVITRAKALSFELGTPITPGLDALVFKASRGIEDIYELTYIRKDGSRFPAVVSVTALRNAQGGIIGHLLIGTDNTARKQVEAEQKKLDQRLRDQQFYTRSLIESNIDAIMTTDSQGIITDVNQQMGALTGCTRDELIGAPFKNYFTDPERAQASIKQVLTEGKVTNYELTARARDGKETVVSYNAIILYDRDRRLQGVFAAARDVTEFKRFEQMLQESNEQLRKLEELRDNLVHMVVHDMRTPLTAIYGFLKTLEMLEGESLSDQGREFVQTALASTEDLVEMVSSLLDVSKMEAGEMKLNLTQCELLTIAREALAKVEPLKGDRQLMLSGAGEPVTVMADAELIARVFQNLLGNALKFTPDGGRVTVSIEPSADSARVLVQDTGPGIPPEYRERIFEKFGQVENPANRQRYSTGIGLTFCKLAVEAHGGQVGVDSEEGRGSTFWFTLPRRESVP